MCDCAQVEDVLGCGDNEIEQFIIPKRLRFLRARPHARLYVCPECGTYWHVDHKQRGPQAIKVKDPFTWETFDDLPYRRKFMERFHGVSQDQRCQWSGCTMPALNGILLCVLHAYPQLSDRTP